MKLTPRSRVKGMLRQIFLRSGERAAALKRDGYTCQVCGRKQSVRKGHELKVQVHHINGLDGFWDEVLDLIYKYLLCDPSELQTLCVECHDKETHHR